MTEQSKLVTTLKSGIQLAPLMASVFVEAIDIARAYEKLEKAARAAVSRRDALGELEEAIYNLDDAKRK